MPVQDTDFLGVGWSFPPTFTANGAELEVTAGAANVHKSVHILLQTGLGERILREDFGCALQRHLFDHLSTRLLENIRMTITNAIRNHEPRVTLERVEIQPDRTDMGLLLISLQYVVKSVNSRFNMVYPFHVNNPK